MVGSRFTRSFCMTSFVSPNLELPHGINSLEVSVAERDNTYIMFGFKLRILAEIRIKAFYDPICVIYIRNNAFLCGLKNNKKGGEETP